MFCCCFRPPLPRGRSGGRAADGDGAQPGAPAEHAVTEVAVDVADNALVYDGSGGASFVEILPRALAARIFARVPVDTRLRCAEVCPAWRDALEEASLWTRLDFCDVAIGSDALLRAAAGRARGALLSLDASGCEDASGWTAEGLLAVVADNAGTLRELRTFAWLRLSDVLALKAAAPLLRVLGAKVSCGPLVVQALLSGEAPYDEPLRVEEVLVWGDSDLTMSTEMQEMLYGGTFDLQDSHVGRVADVVSRAPWLTRLVLQGAPLGGGGLELIVDAVRASPRITALSLEQCGLAAWCAPALARLLAAGSALTKLCIHNHSFAEPLLDVRAATTLALALAANATLTSLTLNGVQLWRDPRVGVMLLASLVGHASLRSLALEHNMVVEHSRVAGAALGMLVAADAPALRMLSVFSCVALRAEELLAPLFEALRCRNTHLRTLYYDHAYLPDAFVRGTLLPALRANTGLTRLVPTYRVFHPEGALEAIAIVNSRGAAGV
jgi:hypothetical protein